MLKNEVARLRALLDPSRLRAVLENHEAIQYDPDLGDTSNPDYVGGNDIESIVLAIRGEDGCGHKSVGGELQWTTERPAAARGWYWFRRDATDWAEIADFRIVGGQLQTFSADQGEWVDAWQYGYRDGEWAGPLIPPD